MEFPEEEQLVLVTILRSRRAWVSGLDGLLVDRLEEAGMVIRWATDIGGHDLEGGPYVTLTPWGAEQLGVELRERHCVRWVHEPDHHERVLIEEPHWVKAGLPQRSFVLPRQAQQCGLEYPELVPDPSPGPEYLVDEEGTEVTLLGGYKVKIDPRLGC